MASVAEDKPVEQVGGQNKAETEEKPKAAVAEGDGDSDPAADAAGGEAKAKKKKRKKKKKGAGEGGAPAGPAGALTQTSPEPTIPVSKLYPSGNYPEGQLMLHPGEHNTFRITSAEKKELDRLDNVRLGELRRAAEVHRQTRQWVMSWIAPGMKMIDITDRLEAKLRELIEVDGLKAGQAFPTGCSLDHVAAHWTPNTGDNEKLEEDSVCKIDFGTHINGRIIDCAWTVSFNPKFDPLKEAVQAATEAGIKAAGIDARVNEIGNDIQEVMESHEIELNGRTHKVRSVRNLNGHSIGPYVIHSGKSVPIIKGTGGEKMEEGEMYAIETFGSTGKGFVNEDMACSHYMMDSPDHPPIRNPKARGLLQHIKKQYDTLAFCRKWLDREGQARHLMALNNLVEAGAVTEYPPLCDVKGSYVAQYEHTLVLRPTCKEILSRGTDY